MSKRTALARRVSIQASQGKLTESLKHTGTGNRAIYSRPDGDVTKKSVIVYSGEKMADKNVRSSEVKIASVSYRLIASITGLTPGLSKRLGRMAKHNKAELVIPKDPSKLVDGNGVAKVTVNGSLESLTSFRHHVAGSEKTKHRVKVSQSTIAADGTGTDTHAKEAHKAKRYLGDGKPSRHGYTDDKPEPEHIDRLEQYATGKTTMFGAPRN